MKNLYLRRTKVLGLFSLLFLCAQITMAQVDITWNGSISSAAEVPQNWTPENPIEGNNLYIGNAGSYTNPCVITVNEDVTVSQVYFTGAPDTEQGFAEGVFTINIAENATFTQGGRDWYGHTGIWNINGGNYYYNSNKTNYMTSVDAIWNVNCDTLDISRAWMSMGSSSLTGGGQLNVSGTTVFIVKDFIRVPTNEVDKVSISLTDAAKLIIAGDRVASIDSWVASGHMVTDADKDIVAVYDPATAKTTVYLRDKNAFIVEPIDKQKLTAGEAGAEITAIDNEGLASMTGGLQWVYGTVDGTYDQSFTPDQTTSSIVPVFVNSGTFYLALKGIDGEGATHYSNSIEIVVSSSKALLSPDVTQNLRPGQDAVIVEVLETPAATEREWKFATTTGGPYESFDPQITGVEFTAPFTELGTYFVICESTIEGNVETTKEIQFNISNDGLNLDWLGTSTDADAMLNWDPAAHVHWNTLNISNLEVANMPILTNTGNDTINKINLIPGATFTIAKPSNSDTINLRGGDHYMNGGSIIVESGIFTKSGNYFRLADNDGSMVVKNDAQCIFENEVIMGNANTATAGGRFIVQNNAQITFLARVWRVGTTVEGISEFEMSDNAKLIFAGDKRGEITTWIDGIWDDVEGVYTSFPKFITPDGTVAYMVYDPNNEISEEGATIVTVRDLSDFGVEQTKTQIVGKGQGTNPLTLINSGAYSSFEWKYSTTTVGPWESFDTPVTGASASVSFATPGTYYVVCVGDALDVTSNAVPVKVVDVSVTPSADQYIDIDADGTELSYTLPDGATGVQWKYATVSGGPYEEFLPAEIGATYLPWGDEFLGKHFIVYEATVTDDDGQQVTVYSNEVTIFVGATAIGDVEAQSLVLYPNPSNGNFNIELEEGASHTITVYNAVGNVVLNKETTGGIVPVSIQGKGIYLVEVASGSSVKVERVVVK